jgi:hypothetical protein
MSTGGLFTLITNDGVQDKLLMATEALSKRIKDLSVQRLIELRRQYPLKSDAELLKEDNSWVPTLNMIERTHVCFINSTFKPFVSIALQYNKIASMAGSNEFGKVASFRVQTIGNFLCDSVVNVRISDFSAVNPADKIRWCEYPGHRLFKSVEFVVNGNKLDTYGTDEYNAYLAYKVPVNKTLGYLRGIGQEIPYVGTLVPNPVVDEYKEFRYFGSGAQTFKRTQPVLDLWIPLLFWFKDIQCSLPGSIIPYGQTYVNIQLESLSNLISYAAYAGTGAYTAPKIEKMELYMNNIFLQPDVYNIFIKKFGFQLMRSHKKHIKNSMTMSSDNILLNSLAFPTETLYIGFRPVANLSNSQLWWRNTVCEEQLVPEAVVIGGVALANNAIYYTETSPIDSFSISAQGVTLYDNSNYLFYNAYLPYRFGPTIKTPESIGWFMVNFGLNPNAYQPSGYLNLSRAREIYLKYNSTYISNTTPTDLIVMSDAINFLLVADGSAILRYAT